MKYEIEYEYVFKVEYMMDDFFITIFAGIKAHGHGTYLGRYVSGCIRVDYEVHIVRDLDTLPVIIGINN